MRCSERIAAPSGRSSRTRGCQWHARRTLRLLSVEIGIVVSDVPSGGLTGSVHQWLVDMVDAGFDYRHRYGRIFTQTSCDNEAGSSSTCVRAFDIVWSSKVAWHARTNNNIVVFCVCSCSTNFMRQSRSFIVGMQYCGHTLGRSAGHECAGTQEDGQRYRAHLRRGWPCQNIS